MPVGEFLTRKEGDLMQLETTQYKTPIHPGLDLFPRFNTFEELKSAFPPLVNLDNPSRRPKFWTRPLLPGEDRDEFFQFYAVNSTRTGLVLTGMTKGDAEVVNFPTVRFGQPSQSLPELFPPLRALTANERFEGDMIGDYVINDKYSNVVVGPSTPNSGDPGKLDVIISLLQQLLSRTK
jgi:hypothetical protein